MNFQYRFRSLRWQAVPVRCIETRLRVAEADWLEMVRRGRGRIRLEVRDGGWTGELRVK